MNNLHAFLFQYFIEIIQLHSQFTSNYPLFASIYHLMLVLPVFYSVLNPVSILLLLRTLSVTRKYVWVVGMKCTYTN